MLRKCKEIRDASKGGSTKKVTVALRNRESVKRESVGGGEYFPPVICPVAGINWWETN